MILNDLVKKYKSHELDFVYPKLEGDTKVYLDLYFLYHSPDQRWHKVHTLIFSYFNHYLELYRAKKITDEECIEKLKFPEVPYIALGHCKDGIYGAGSADDRAEVIKDSIFDNEEVKGVGLVALAGTSITIGGLGPDLLSDLVANFGIHHLLEYTAEQVSLYGLKTSEFQISRALNVQTMDWIPLQKIQLPYFEKDDAIEPRILVPKHIVKRLPIYTTDGYYDNYLKYLIQEEKGDRIKNIRTFGKVPKYAIKDIASELKRKYGSLGDAARELGLKFPNKLQEYINDPFKYKKSHIRKRREKIDWDAYFKELKNIKTGREFAHLYADTVRKIFTAMYSGDFVNGLLEERSDDGIYHYDITFANAAKTSLFTFLKNQQIKAGLIIVEAKNYGKTKVSNTQFNQANGYSISDAREFVMLVMRSPVTEAHIKKARRHFLAQKHLILPIGDKDIKELLEGRFDDQKSFDYFLIKRAQKIMQA